jgi:hypothetical protein
MNLKYNAEPPTDAYAIRGVEPGHDVVEGWLDKGLPFEPKGVDREFRCALRRAIPQLSVAPGDVLHAVYASEVVANYDAENILFYNVGVGPFAGLTRLGLRFERAYVTPPTSPGALRPFRHYHRYWMSSRADRFRHWDKVQIVARFEAEPITSMPELRAPSSIWHRVKRSGTTIPNSSAIVDQHFGVSITIRKPHNSALSLASIAKAVLDGVISAFHAHDGTKLDDVSERLGAKLRMAPADARCLLLDKRRDLLGTRRLIWPTKKSIQSIQWNPADDRCVAVELLIDDTGTESGWELSGELFTVRPRPAE